MKAIEFVTQVKNGIIEVPKKYLKIVHDKCRVIILVESNKVSSKSKKLSSLMVKTKGLVFNRNDS